MHLEPDKINAHQQEQAASLCSTDIISRRRLVCHRSQTVHVRHTGLLLEEGIAKGVACHNRLSEPITPADSSEKTRSATNPGNRLH